MARKVHYVSVTDARSSLPELLNIVEGQDEVLLMRHNQPVAVLVHPSYIEALREEIEDLDDRLSVAVARLDPSDRVPLEKVGAELGLLGR